MFLYNQVDEEAEDVFNKDITTYLQIMEQLKYNECPREKIMRWLKEYADDGEYAFTDAYLNTGLRCYEQLALIENEATQDSRSKLYLFLKKNLAGCLDIDTGGVTG